MSEELQEHEKHQLVYKYAQALNACLVYLLDEKSFDATEYSKLKQVLDDLKQTCDKYNMFTQDEYQTFVAQYTETFRASAFGEPMPPQCYTTT